jgi:hypothetical protein
MFQVRDVIVSVFDTVAPANALCITRSGLLFAASEFGDHALFQFSGIGDGEGVCTSRKCDDAELGDDGASAASVAPTFAPPPLLLTGRSAAAAALGAAGQCRSDVLRKRPFLGVERFALCLRSPPTTNTHKKKR